mmetsp:Transcript_20105/g.28900  ORF Transcript_20105/g.28900 Transcript_20105/m.28900 type:complete len:598 (+) Transcript_20105:142-1935(+)|eukprot:CAMPEP_0185027942 /NCGR_PEP_ID=MMETSP1103-20130426/13293_1 /TAXON_ID=36769 /ORGANISM="Paraphysomonas bandaiensis, Strain Caron Lab Isolate" /LENGTH=597 /DNA_ID=CAMNT_0027562147 /DNA_START=87 /DNA_END=1880 /DNA_ORIENTATION=-
MSYQRKFTLDDHDYSDDSDYGRKHVRGPRRSHSPDYSDDDHYDRARTRTVKRATSRSGSRNEDRYYNESDDDDEGCYHRRPVRSSRSNRFDDDVRGSREKTSFAPRRMNNNDIIPSSRPSTANSVPSSAWGDVRRDSWAEKENDRPDEPVSKPWTRARAPPSAPHEPIRRSRDEPRDYRTRNGMYSDREASSGEDNEMSPDDVPPRRPPPRGGRGERHESGRGTDNYGEVRDSREPPRSDRRNDRYGPSRGRDGDDREVRDSRESPRIDRMSSDGSFYENVAATHIVGSRDEGSVGATSYRRRADTDGTSNDIEDLSTYSDDGADHIKDDGDSKRRGHDSSRDLLKQSSIPFVQLSPANGGATDMVQCLIVRERGSIGSKLYPSYKLFLEDKNKLLLIGRKMNFNSTSNYHVFDMTRGSASKKMTKKSGNYMGKLRAHDTNRTEYALVTRKEEREEIAAIVFDRVGIVNQIKEGCQPRKMSVLLPQLNAESQPIPHKVTDAVGRKKSMVDMLRKQETGRMFLLTSKEPVFENGNYRLNFHGRVSVPSVKNFQLSSPDDPSHVICQFGKIGEDRFHLDYKAPLNAFQAFSLALCHFDT